MWHRVVPHPYLSLTLIGVWVLLVNHLDVGTMVMAVLLGTVIPLLTSVWWPYRTKVRAPVALASYVLLVLWDVIIANIQVAAIIVAMPSARIRSAWIAVPLDLATPEAITLLAGTITMTPGTLTADISACGRVLLVHALHAPDPDAVCRLIKSRYETRLKRIFE